MENREQILEAQIQALKELIAIKDQTIAELKTKQVVSQPSITWSTPNVSPWGPYVSPYPFGPSSGTLTIGNEQGNFNTIQGTTINPNMCVSQWTQAK